MKKIVLPTIAVFVAWVVLDMIIHGVILGPKYEENADLWLSKAEMRMGLLYVVTLIYAFTFVAIYSWFFREKGMGPGLKYGLLFGLGAGVAMGYGSYSVMTIPYYMAITWFLGTLVEMIIAGIIVGAIDKGKGA